MTNKCVSSYLNEAFLYRIQGLVSLHPQLLPLDAQFSLLKRYELVFMCTFIALADTVQDVHSKRYLVFAQLLSSLFL